MQDLAEVKELEKEVVSPVIVAANQISVVNADQYQGAADFLKQIKDAQKKVADYWKPLKEKAHAAWKEITGKESEMLTPLKDAETTVKSKMLTFQQAEEEKRQVEQRRLQAEADERARKERERLLKHAESLKTPEKQEEYRQAAEEVVAPVITVETETPKVAGISTRKTWVAEIVDKKVFIAAAVNDPNLMALVEIDLSKLNKIAAATKGQISYPGVKFSEKVTMAAGGR